MASSSKDGEDGDSLPDGNSLSEISPTSVPPKRKDRLKRTEKQKELDEVKRRKEFVAAGVGDKYTKGARLAVAMLKESAKVSQAVSQTASEEC